MQHDGTRIFTRQEDLKFRRELRREATPAETALWKRLKAGQVEGLKFRRQHSIGSYVMDFYCPHLKLCIELDGNVHDSETAREHDDVRTEFINHLVSRYYGSAMRLYLTDILTKLYIASLPFPIRPI